MKKRITLLLVFCTVSILCLGQNLNEGLIGFYPFNGTPDDESGSGNNLINFGAISAEDKNSMPDKAFYFDKNTFVAAPDSNMFYDLDSSFSIALSYYAESLSSAWPSIINKIHASGTSFTGFYLGIDSIRNILRFRVGNYYIETPSTLNRWNQVVATFGNSSLKLYVNGQLIGSKQIMDINSKNKESLTIGRQSQPQSELKGKSYFTGKIDDIRIYKRILSQAEVDLLYADFSTRLPEPGQTHTITISPNPAKDKIMVSIADFPGNGVFMLYISDPMGQIVHKSVIDQNNAVIYIPSRIARGLYFVNITDAHSRNIVTRKILLQ